MADFTPTEMQQLRQVITEFFTDMQGKVNAFPSPHHIENVVKDWVENDLHIGAIISDITNLRNDVSKAEQTVSNIVKNIASLKSDVAKAEQTAEGVYEGIEGDVERVIGQALKAALEAAEQAIKPVLKEVVNLYTEFPPANAQFRVGVVTLSWNDLSNKTLAARLYTMIERDQADLVSIIDFLEPDQVGVDIEVDIPIVGESSLGIELQANWDIPTFKKVWDKIKGEFSSGVNDDDDTVQHYLSITSSKLDEAMQAYQNLVTAIELAPPAKQ